LYLLLYFSPNKFGVSFWILKKYFGTKLLNRSKKEKPEVFLHATAVIYIHHIFPRKAMRGLAISSPYPHLQDNVKVKEIIGKTGDNSISKKITRKMDDIFNEEYSFLSAN